LRYLLDTNILLHYIRRDAIAKQIDDQWHPFSSDNHAIISIVSFGEIRSLAIQSDWGDRKLFLLDQFLKMVLKADLTLDIVERYAEIDAYSQGKSKTYILYQSARNMGKNDLWIAATASVLNAKLLTTDADFDHLNNVYLDLQKVTAF
jgi:tRNA(fMet)-specific endonuclease VapC